MQEEDNGSTTDCLKFCDLFIEGIHMGEKLNRLLKYILNIHLAEQKPISKANVRQIFVLIQFVKVLNFLNFFSFIFRPFQILLPLIGILYSRQLIMVVFIFLLLFFQFYNQLFN